MGIKLSFPVSLRNFMWRLGRFLYQYSRGDIPGKMEDSGETNVQQCVFSAWEKLQSNRGKLVVFDVGANVGDWAANIIKCFSGSQDQALLELHTFEPVPETFSILKTRLSKISSKYGDNCHQLALSSEAGIGKMFVLGTSGANSLNSGKATNEASISVQKETLHRFCTQRSIKEIHLLKCDAEGHDMDVLMGALPLLKEGKIQVFQFEYNYHWVYSRHYLKDVFDVLAELPYRLGKVMPDGVELYPEWHFESERFFEANYVLIRKDSLHLLETREVVFAADNTLVPLNR